MRINIWIVLVVLIALLAVTRLSRCQQDTQHIGVRAVSFVLAHFGSYRLTMYLLPKQHAALPVSAAVIAVTGYPSSRPLFRLARLDKVPHHDQSGCNTNPDLEGSARLEAGSIPYTKTRRR